MLDSEVYTNTLVVESLTFLRWIQKCQLQPARILLVHFLNLVKLLSMPAMQNA